MCTSPVALFSRFIRRRNEPTRGRAEVAIQFSHWPRDNYVIISVRFNSQHVTANASNVFIAINSIPRSGDRGERALVRSREKETWRKRRTRPSKPSWSSVGVRFRRVTVHERWLRRRLLEISENVCFALKLWGVLGRFKGPACVICKWYRLFFSLPLSYRPSWSANRPWWGSSYSYALVTDVFNGPYRLARVAAVFG